MCKIGNSFYYYFYIFYLSDRYEQVSLSKGMLQIPANKLHSFFYFYGKGFHSLLSSYPIKIQPALIIKIFEKAYFKRSALRYNFKFDIARKVGLINADYSPSLS
jgi:hypothetical protein